MSFSVLLSVYRNEQPACLTQAFESIWDAQTLKPGQIVLVQDGPLPQSLKDVVAYWKQVLADVLTIVPLAQNVGLGAALNEGLKHCHYELVVRMDTDDMALPERFAKQVAFMEQRPDITASSAILEEWDETLQTQLGVRQLPTEPADVLRFAKRRSPLSHPLAIFRKSVVLELGGYPPLRKAQDYALWSLLLSKGYQLANLPDVLLKMRSGDNMLGRRGWGYFKHEFQLLRFQRQIGFLSAAEFATNVLLKAVLRLSPTFMKRLAYKVAR